MIRECSYCGSLIRYGANLNRIYCNNYCYYSAKKKRQKYNRTTEKKLLAHKKKTEDTLASLWIQFGHGMPFDPKYAEEKEMDFSLADQIKSVEKYRTVVIGNYAYLISNFKTMQVWKL